MTRNKLRSPLAVIAILAAGACVAGQVDEAGPSRDRIEQALASDPQFKRLRRCDAAPPGKMACHARLRLDAAGKMSFAATAAAVTGLGPSALKRAYAIDQTLGAGATIAIVDAY